MPCQESTLEAAEVRINGQRRAPRVLGPVPPLLSLEGEVGRGSQRLHNNHRSEEGPGKFPDLETADLPQEFCSGSDQKQGHTPVPTTPQGRAGSSGPMATPGTSTALNHTALRQPALEWGGEGRGATWAEP